MLFRKKMDTGNIKDIHFANGSIQFLSVKLNVYSYVMDGILIDSGAQSLAPLFQQFFQTQSFDGLYCTHIHEDHTGGCAWLQKQRNIPIYLNQLSVSEAAESGKYPLYRKVFWGTRQPFYAQECPETFSSRRYSWETIFTPGHSRDHTAFLNRSTGQLFSGDLYVSRKTKVVMETESIPQMIKSIEYILTFDFKEMFCCHAGYIEDGKDILRQKLNNLHEVTDQVRQLHEKGMPADEIHQLLFPRKYPITFFSKGQWDSKHIVTSILKE
ncbi:MBL fold metallo-hydrolase [Bacillus sp. ISL-51]|uniref:MBL fold metallo-hydrolase n=1 Tax=unclassified Bacillus (in: firmicutes) TaxID=185979 RepID=UPI001BEB178A|nr:MULTISPECIES: MBL fold metallo-hydrolase [unclassified Bacillus (in: firmicutes)]MBT2574324.1 MBL fold metallo-hydrolase [Bacillus sp. ISL-51]MBT2633141.1 MBL fold metallo-hydrolase [Bacillus sp. ISL-26]